MKKNLYALHERGFANEYEIKAMTAEEAKNWQNETLNAYATKITSKNVSKMLNANYNKPFALADYQCELYENEELKKCDHGGCGDCSLNCAKMFYNAD